MTNTLVLQSAPDHRAKWLNACLASVEDWAARAKHQYRFIGDELFDAVPDWYMHKVNDRMPIAADLGRLIWIKKLLEAGEARTVIWLDADVFVFAPSKLNIDPLSSCVFGQELWVESVKTEKKLNKNHSGRWQVRRNVHNALAAFRKDCPVLPFLIELILRMMSRVDADFIAPQMMGPKLLTHLHSLADFELIPAVGALSPSVIGELASQLSMSAKPSGALNALLVKQSQPLLAANLCASLVTQVSPDTQVQEVFMCAAIEKLNAYSEGLS
jgi:hypothetical protein